ncbi:uncharacterized protein LOC106669393 isoform X2 [Cimex lectularius]|nr:uncharacterized protein LOC106669393 isoform X2 [Cimex lectularius]XP_024080351.1 uncharacterized protein LOC106669393 isoform X2 [Cimex lectularius]
MTELRFVLIKLALICAHFVTTHGGCKFPASWTGQWFQSGIHKPNIAINLTHIETKGQCVEKEDSKYLLFDRKEKCYRCIAMYNKHTNVLQYKETFCMEESSLENLCDSINGDATLLSMFRVDATGVPCPFKSPPFSVVYSKGHGECGGEEGEPPSRVESCTDESKLVFKFQACPDIPGTEATVEELECLGMWKESSNHYLVGRLNHKMATTDEERYRCFVYRKLENHGYEFSQSGEATCAGMVSASDGGSRMVKLRRETGHTRCKFPTWVIQRNHWHSLDYSHFYHFSHKNASLRVTTPSRDTETKLICHKIISQKHNVAAIVVHVVSGCEGGYKCMTIHKRDSQVIQMQMSELLVDINDPTACSSEEPSSSSNTVTLISKQSSASLPSNRCPMEGRYAPLLSNPIMPGEPADQIDQECGQQTSLVSLAIGCSPMNDVMEFHSNCRTVPPTSYSCHGSWRENLTTYVVGSPISRHSTDARHYCFVFTQTTPGGPIVLQRLVETCATPLKHAEWSFNLTEIGKCTETSTGHRVNSLLCLLLLPLAVFLVNIAHR